MIQDGKAVESARERGKREGRAEKREEKAMGQEDKKHLGSPQKGEEI